MSLKNPVTPPGIDPGTVRLVAQRLNHYATPGPLFVVRSPTFSSRLTYHLHGVTSNDVSTHVVTTVVNAYNY
jgi:hypothetical protein